MQSISVKELQDLLSAGLTGELIDVRSPEEYAGGHIPGAKNVPGQELMAYSNALPKGSVLYLVCHSGSRSRLAQVVLTNIGHVDIVNVQGGTGAWAEAGYPLQV